MVLRPRGRPDLTLTLSLSPSLSRSLSLSLSLSLRLSLALTLTLTLTLEQVAQTYTEAQHNGSVATAKYLIKKKLQLGGVSSMLDVGGGSGAFSYVFTEATPGLNSTVLELPEVCRTGETIKAKQSADVQQRVKYVELDATSPNWPVDDEVSCPTPVQNPPLRQVRAQS